MIDDLLSQVMRYPDKIVAPTKKTLKSMLFELTQMLHDLEKNSQQLPAQLISNMFIMCIGNAVKTLLPGVVCWGAPVWRSELRWAVVKIEPGTGTGYASYLQSISGQGVYCAIGM